MNCSFKQIATFLVATVGLLFGVAVSAQSNLSGTARWSSVYEKISSRDFPLTKRPRGCFCDEDCMAALERQAALQRQPARAIANWRPSYLTPTGDIKVIDLDALKKLLQRDPKDTRPLLINFWATWCDPCREEFPDLVKVDNDYRNKGLNFIAISLDDLTDIKTAVPKFLTEMKAEMRVVLLNVNDPEPAIKAVDATWDGQMPATFLYDKDGKVVFKHFGKINPDELRAAIDKEVNKQK
ncbi:MAG TPA: TlpA disulfide reductase family protein [Pyrinomonadaceae bacterium]|nr:TlpA disulfide reductase family protein [Pyrinomonadaceae bacterium]